MSRFVNISLASKILNLVDPITKKPKNHILRYWEKEFKVIRPKIINNRRYYSPKQIKTLKKIKFLLKNEGISISGVKNIFKSKSNILDGHKSYSLKADYYKSSLKQKSKVLLRKINKIKSYGKKNAS